MNWDTFLGQRTLGIDYRFTPMIYRYWANTCLISVIMTLEQRSTKGRCFGVFAVDFEQLLLLLLYLLHYCYYLRFYYYYHHYYHYLPLSFYYYCCYYNYQQYCSCHKYCFFIISTFCIIQLPACVRLFSFMNKIPNCFSGHNFYNFYLWLFYLFHYYYNFTTFDIVLQLFCLILLTFVFTLLKS